MSRINPKLMLLVAIVIFVALTTHLLVTIFYLTPNNTISEQKKSLAKMIEAYVNECWLAKTSKNLGSCREHIMYIYDQCKTNATFTGVPACSDPRIDQMVEEQKSLAVSP